MLFSVSLDSLEVLFLSKEPKFKCSGESRDRGPSRRRPERKVVLCHVSAGFAQRGSTRAHWSQKHVQESTDLWIQPNRGPATAIAEEEPRKVGRETKLRTRPAFSGQGANSFQFQKAISQKETNRGCATSECESKCIQMRHSLRKATFSLKPDKPGYPQKRKGPKNLHFKVLGGLHLICCFTQSFRHNSS